MGRVTHSHEYRDGDNNAFVDPDALANQNIYDDSDPDIDAPTYQYADAHSDAKTVAYTYGIAYGDRYEDADPYANRVQNEDGNADTDFQLDAKTVVHCDVV